MQNAPSGDHWVRHAAQWQHVGPPLRPCRADIDRFEQLLVEAIGGEREGGLRALLLGVTPEIAGMRWPAGTTLTAVDRCPGMIAVVWPEQLPALRAKVVQSDWSRLPAEDASLDIVIGDGCYTALDPAAGRALTREARRVLRPDGAYLLRLFVRPPAAETPADVFTDLLQGRIGSFHAFKWRLAMAVHGDRTDGVRVGEVWEAWQERGLDAPALAERLGWSPESIRTIEVYREGTARYSFPTIEEARAMLSEHFVELACHWLGYELGDRCPILSWRPR